MNKICVITGGGSGIGLAAAKYIGKTHNIILVGRTPEKLESAVQELNHIGILAKSFPCDISKRDSVKELVLYAASCGTVESVVHAAGLSPNMANAEVLFHVNAMSCIYINEEFSKVMPSGSCIINVSSMSAYLVPKENLPTHQYKLSLTNSDEFMHSLLTRIKSFPEELAAQYTYTITKNFVIWYAQNCAYLYGKRGIRVLSVSPGTFATPMAEIEGEHAKAIANQGALGRVGEPNEIASLINFLVSDGASYITGTDILCDGGAIAGILYAREECETK